MKDNIINNEISENNLQAELKNRWKLWFHKVDDNNWTIDSYKVVCELKTFEDVIYLLKALEHITSGMFFLMKNDILPVYEVDENKDGGYWSFKISKTEAYEIWQKIVYIICLDQWYSIIEKNKYVNDEFISNINGISVSPKINNCIIKIWISKYEKKYEQYLSSFFTENQLGEFLYKPHNNALEVSHKNYDNDNNDKNKYKSRFNR